MPDVAQLTVDAVAAAPEGARLNSWLVTYGGESQIYSLDQINDLLTSFGITK